MGTEVGQVGPQLTTGTWTTPPTRVRVTPLASVSKPVATLARVTAQGR